MEKEFKLSGLMVKVENDRESGCSIIFCLPNGEDFSKMSFVPISGKPTPPAKVQSALVMSLIKALETGSAVTFTEQ